MWNELMFEVIKNIIIPELASFMRRKYEETGHWPTKEELESKANDLAEEIKRVGYEFLERLKQEAKEHERIPRIIEG